MPGNCTIHFDDACITLEDGEVVEIESAFDRNHNQVDPCDPACVVIVAGPRSDGNWLTVTINGVDPRTLH